MTTPEFSRRVGADTIGEGPRHLAVEAGPAERAALARRFGLPGIGALAAEIVLTRRESDLLASGTIEAEVTQSCAASGEPVAARVAAPFEIVFRPPPPAGLPDEEVELDANALDVVFYEGGSIDLGEAVAETLLLNLDPYPRAAGAEEILKAAGVKSEGEAGPFGALASLGDKLKDD